MKKLNIILSGLLLILVGLFLLNRNPEKAEAVAGQLSAAVATSSTVTVSTAAVTAFATSTCASRIVTTNAQPIRFEFSDRDGFVLSTAIGHTQLASTTVAYDASVYGCGHWKAISGGPAGTDAGGQGAEQF